MDIAGEDFNRFAGRWEERWHPLLEQWIVVSAHRENRPWQGQRVAPASESVPVYDASCHLCPGNERVSGLVHPKYSGVFVFDNDHPGMSLRAPTKLSPAPAIYRNRPASGVARVICYSPTHNATLAELDLLEIENVISVWQRETHDLSQTDGIKNVVAFENKGEVCGVSNPHPHGQVFATNFSYANIDKHVDAARRHFSETGRVLFQDILSAEESDGRRIIAANDSAIAFVPYFSRYPYEVYVAPRKTHPHITSLNAEEASGLAAVLQSVLIMFDNLWEMSFPYVKMLHQAPIGVRDKELFHFHIVFYPPLRKPGLLKFLGGPETGGGNFHADTIPDDKAADLRNASGVHYKRRAQVQAAADTHLSSARRP